MEKNNNWLIDLLVLILLASTCPKREDHVEAIKTEMGSRIGASLLLWAGDFEVNNWILFSVGKTKKGDISSFGILNHVFVHID